MEPRVESLDITQPGQVAPCVYERFLYGVLGDVAASGDQAGEAVQLGDPLGHQGREGVVITELRLGYEVEGHCQPHGYFLMAMDPAMEDASSVV
jgi:hypothetical protein